MTFVFVPMFDWLILFLLFRPGKTDSPGLKEKIEDILCLPAASLWMMELSSSLSAVDIYKSLNSSHTISVENKAVSSRRPLPPSAVSAAEVCQVIPLSSLLSQQLTNTTRWKLTTSHT